jgi:hypothetical protein
MFVLRAESPSTNDFASFPTGKVLPEDVTPQTSAQRNMQVTDDQSNDYHPTVAAALLCRRVPDDGHSKE